MTTAHHSDLKTESRLETLIRKVHAFLARGKPAAFSVIEVQQSLRADEATYGETDLALSRLVEMGAAAVRLQSCDPYYTYGGDLPRST